MTETMIGRIRQGAAVDWADGRLGRVVRVEQGAAGATGRIQVLADDTGRTLFVPLDLVDEVRADGTVRLSAARAELDRFAVGEAGTGATEGRTLELREEQLEARKELEETGRIRVHKQVEDVPRRLEVEAYQEEVTVEHVPIGRIVKEREPAREEDDVYIIPIYEEQLVVVKRLVLAEEIRVRRRGATERRLFEDTVRRERLVIEDPDRTGRVRELYATEPPEGERVAGDTLPGDEEANAESEGFFDRLGRRILE